MGDISKDLEGEKELSKEAMRSALKAGANIHAGNGGYSLGTREKYDAFVKVRNESLNLEQEEQLNCDRQSEPLVWSTTQGGAYVCGEYYVVQRVDDKGWNAHKDHEHLLLAASLGDCKAVCEQDALTGLRGGMKEAIKQMVKALETEAEIYNDYDPEDGPPEYIVEALKVGRQAIAHVEPQSVQQRTWVGLTDEDIRKLAKENIYVLNAIIATNTKLKEKNHGR